MDINLKNGRCIKDVGVKLAVTLVFAAVVVLIYATGVGCVFRYFFGIRCPGCGLTRAFLSFFELELVLAFRYHPLFLTTPLLYLYYIFDGRIFGRVADALVLCGIFGAFLIRWIIILI